VNCREISSVLSRLLLLPPTLLMQRDAQLNKALSVSVHLQYIDCDILPILNQPSGISTKTHWNPPQLLIIPVEKPV